MARKYNPASDKAQLASALVSIRTGETERGIEALNALLRADPTNPQYALYKAGALRDLGRPNDEETVYRQIIRNRPNYWPAYNELGYVLQREGRNEEAAKAYAEASVVSPLAAMPLANIGSVFLALGRRSEAADAFRRSLERAPSDDAYSNLGTLQFEARDYQKALVNYRKACDLKPRDAENWRNLADCETKLGHPAQARDDYAKAASIAEADVQTNPKLGPVWMALAFYRAKAGDRSGVDSAIHAGQRNGASDIHSLLFKAQALAATGRQKEALNLVLELLKRGLPPAEVELALDLDQIRQDSRYKQALERKQQ